MDFDWEKLWGEEKVTTTPPQNCALIDGTNVEDNAIDVNKWLPILDTVDIEDIDLDEDENMNSNDQGETEVNTPPPKDTDCENLKPREYYNHNERFMVTPPDWQWPEPQQGETEVITSPPKDTDFENFKPREYIEEAKESPLICNEEIPKQPGREGGCKLAVKLVVNQPGGLPPTTTWLEVPLSHVGCGEKEAEPGVIRTELEEDGARLEEVELDASEQQLRHKQQLSGLLGKRKVAQQQHMVDEAEDMALQDPSISASEKEKIRNKRKSRRIRKEAKAKNLRKDEVIAILKEELAKHKSPAAIEQLLVAKLKP